LPNQTFDGTIVFYGSQRSVELATTGKGHTESDCILRLPQERIVFIGDLGFFQAQPFMASCSPPEWLKILDEMAGWEIETFVPGHGPLGGKTDLARQAAYIRALEDMVRGVVQDGGSIEDALRQSLPEPFRAWQMVGASRFESNVRTSYDQRWSQVKGVMEDQPDRLSLVLCHA
jgi:cyclase